MESSLPVILGFSLLGSVGALIGGGVLLAFPKLHERWRTPLLSYAVGSLLGATFIALLPEAIERAGVSAALGTTLGGIVFFFALEKVLRIPHRHAQSDMHPEHLDEKIPLQPAAPLILIGDAFHNFVDGILIAIAFSVATPLGITTALAVIAHEVPQELGDLVVLVEGGMERRRAYWLNLATSLTTCVGAAAAFAFRTQLGASVPYVLAVSASSFLYVATVDVAPMLHHSTGGRTNLKQTVFLVVGILTIWLLDLALH